MLVYWYCPYVCTQLACSMRKVGWRLVELNKIGLVLCLLKSNELVWHAPFQGHPICLVSANTSTIVWSLLMASGARVAQ